MKLNLQKMLLCAALPLCIYAARPRSYRYKSFKLHIPHVLLNVKGRDFYPQAFIEVPLVRQSTNWTCGVASLMSVLGFFGIEYREDILAKELQSNSDIGTNYKNIVAVAQRELQKKYPKATVIARNGMTLKDLEAAVNKGNLVQVAFQAWADDPKTVNYKTDNDDGHYSIVIGYDQDKLYFMDPSTIGNYTYIPKQEFMDRWHDVDGTSNEPVINFGIEYAINADYALAYQPNNLVKLSGPYSYPHSMAKSGRQVPVDVPLPKTCQPSNWTSQLTCLQSILYYYGVEYRPDQLAEDLGIKANTLASNKFVTIENAKLIAFVKEQLLKNNPQAQIEYKEKMTLAQLQKIVNQKKPILVECEPWTTEATNLDDGRYVVVIGFDKTNIIIMSPSTLGNYTSIDKNEFEKRWKRTGFVFSNGTKGATYHTGAIPKLD